MLAGIVLLAVATWLWFTMLSPWHYQRPPALAPIADGPHQVFVYGTLRYALVRYLVMGTSGSPAAATLGGYRRCGLNIAPIKEPVAITQPPPDSEINGLVLEVSAVELARLDRYERLGVRYTRRRITLQDDTRAWVYRRLASKAPAGEAIGCPGSDTIDRPD
ncbi:MAG: gamma-glutamylcyclotransferase [Halomonas sp.]|nr:gamma-glutamylcyclotransferase family protein [Halomonas sp.]MDN6297327.1 gamma-glutamylcyclotransferase [Halomonas sp.]MDN6315096.1 gamma-glutamylcyclotransferase [Halomonas sp.]MDN6336605.1 gamma-glutamylcyclotransferase [Halomonas sp.]